MYTRLTILESRVTVALRAVAKTDQDLKKEIGWFGGGGE